MRSCWRISHSCFLTCTPALATRGFGDAEFTEVADIIATALAAGKDADITALRARVSRLALDVPLYSGLEDWGMMSGR